LLFNQTKHEQTQLKKAKVRRAKLKYRAPCAQTPGERTMTSFRMISVALLGVALSFSILAAEPEPAVEHVVVIGVDGMTAKSLEVANTPNMHALMALGSYTRAAHSVKPTVSGPNWGSMLMGSKPETHGIVNNSWTLDADDPFPTVFTALRAADPNAVLVAAYEWDTFGKLFVDEVVTQRIGVDKEAIENDTSENAASRYIATQAAQCIKEKKPKLTFIHLDMVDHAGHSYVYDSEKYNVAVGEADELVGIVVKGVDDAGIRKNTAIFVVSDHGGIDKGHGGDTPEETIVPWIVAGAGIVKGAAIPDGISVAQTGPTIAALLGAELPARWTMKPVSQVLKK